jgi:hypothetical protein
MGYRLYNSAGKAEFDSAHQEVSTRHSPDGKQRWTARKGYHLDLTGTRSGSGPGKPSRIAVQEGCDDVFAQGEQGGLTRQPGPQPFTRKSSPARYGP